MEKSILNIKDYYSKVYGGWLGKNIGGTLGAPVEGEMKRLNLAFYPVLSGKPLENDDLDLQLVWLHALEQYGVKLTAKQLGQEWLEHVFFCSDEYGYALTNLRRGLQAPVCGSFNNPFTDGMGSPIRSEIWAMIAPGAPEVAAFYAYQDAIVDHAGGEGVYGEMFFAAIESAAFVESDRDRLIAIGLSFIPAHSRTSCAVHDLLGWHKEGKSWEEARELVLQHHGNTNFTDVPQNIAFTILGWLYGEDFGDALLKAVNCGYDTDCTAATLGSILGIICGAEKIPACWIEPIGHTIVVSPPIKGFNVPLDLHELTTRTIVVGRAALAEWSIPLIIADEHPTQIVQTAGTGINDARQLVENLLEQDVTVNCYLLPEGAHRNMSLEVQVAYGSTGPAIGKEMRKSLFFTLHNHSQEAWEGRLALAVPAGWEKAEAVPLRLAPGEQIVWNAYVQSDAELQPAYELALLIQRDHSHSPWSTHQVRFVLVAAAHWTLSGPRGDSPIQVAFPGNRLDIAEALPCEEPGIYRAETILVNPRRRNVMLVAATASPIQAYLNGALLFEDASVTTVMPAYHRSPPGKLAVIELSEGRHKLELVIDKGAEPLEVHVLPVEPWETISPGPCNYYIDILFDRP